MRIFEQPASDIVWPIEADKCRAVRTLPLLTGP